jgi:hypothetical protein
MPITGSAPGAGRGFIVALVVRALDHYPHADNGRPAVCAADGLAWPCPDSGEGADLSALNRSELNAYAAGAGVDAPESLPNKAAVVDAIVGATSAAE